MSKLNIYQRINKVMEKVSYVKRGSAGQGTGVKYDEVLSKLRAAMIEQGIITVQKQIGNCLIISENGKQKLYSGDFNIELVNMDDPSDRVNYTITAHGMDAGDKAPGKLSTYALKTVYVKAFGMESGINDESRAEVEDRKNGNMPATGQECTAILKMIKDVNPDNLDKCYEHLESKTGATRKQIGEGALNQAQAYKINKILKMAANKNG